MAMHGAPLLDSYSAIKPMMCILRDIGRSRTIDLSNLARLRKGKGPPDAVNGKMIQFYLDLAQPAL